MHLVITRRQPSLLTVVAHYGTPLHGVSRVTATLNVRNKPSCGPRCARGESLRSSDSLECRKTDNKQREFAIQDISVRPRSSFLSELEPRNEFAILIRPVGKSQPHPRRSPQDLIDG